MVYFQNALKFLIKYKFYFIVGAVLTAAAVIAFVTTGQSSNTPKEQTTTTISASESNSSEDVVLQTTQDSSKKSTSATKQTDNLTATKTTKSDNKSETSEVSSNAQSKSNTSPTEKPEKNSTQNSSNKASNSSNSNNNSKTTTPTKPKETQKKESTCTIEINCSTILNNLDKFNNDKLDVLPKNGIMLDTQTVKISNGDTVFDILQKACKQKSILIVSSYTPAYGSRYIKSIGNIGEFDCGNMSGWTYSVNGEFLSNSCSKNEVKDGDTIKWLYTCNNGKDVRDE